MLYVSTRNSVDTYTAYRALHESAAPDGGFYVPFRLPVFTEHEILSFRRQSWTSVIAEILNRFFGVSLTAWDVECAIGRSPIKLEAMNHKILVASMWLNPDASFTYLLKELYALMTKNTAQKTIPEGWSCIAIKIALLFAIYANLEDASQKIDIAVIAGDFSDITAIRFAKDMGLPVNLVICSCDENSSVWDLINRGELHPKNTCAACLEGFLYKAFGTDCVAAYLEAVNGNNNLVIDKEQLADLNQFLYASVVSEARVETVRSGIYRSNQYNASADMALAYGGLQDYRSATGVSKDTLIFEKNQPKRLKE